MLHFSYFRVLEDSFASCSFRFIGLCSNSFSGFHSPVQVKFETSRSGDDNSAFYYVLEFTGIARPVVDY